ncbi:hypothetical protein AVEN_93568-1, partial [Araneus ventricosus]
PFKYHCEPVDSAVEVDDAVHYLAEFLHTLDPPGIPPHVLYLAVGAPIMRSRNLNSPKLRSGTRLQVKTLYRHVIQAKIITGVKQGEAVFIPRNPLIPLDQRFTTWGSRETLGERESDLGNGGKHET